jgi:hypothetical protein
MGIMSRHIEAWCPRKAEDCTKVKELIPAAWHKALCAGCGQKVDCARWSWEASLNDSERQAAREELAKHPWRPVTYESLYKAAFGLWSLDHPIMPGITYSVEETVERRDAMAEKDAETRALYLTGDITERGQLLGGGEKFRVD